MQETETRKTIIYALVAGMAVLVAWEPWEKGTVANNVPIEVGTKLFPDFKQPLDAKSLEVMRFDEETAILRPFKVAQVNGVWSIPSHSNYPADAREHMAQAATALVDLEILGVASSNKGDRELYGVITPDPNELKQGSVGVGTRVTIKDGKENTLADLVIGKEVKDNPAVRYARRADRDQIYRISIKTDKLSTKFEDWIEKDLLKLNAFDVRQVQLNDYSAQLQQGGVGLDLRSRIKVDFDDTKSKWDLVELSEFDPKGQATEVKLADDEELNSEKLNNLKTAIDDLQIIDVERKPAGLSQDLRVSDEFVKNNEAARSLALRGFIPVGRRDGQGIEILSSEGEATCTTKDGVRYVLRFGNLAGGEDEAKEESKDGEKSKAKTPALNRFLFVMAEFDESQIPKPQLEAIAGEAPPSTEAAEKKDDDKPAADEAKSDDKPADEKAADEKPADAKVPEQKTADQGKPAAPPVKAGTGKTAPAKPAGSTKADGAKAAADATKPAAANAKPATDAKPASDAKPTPAPDAAPKAEAKEAEKPADAPKLDPQAEEEKKVVIRKDNKRKQDDYDSSIKKGQDRVKELNDRFADWYFIISDDVYKKIHLGRADIINKKKAAGDKAGQPDAPAGLDLKQFEQGLNKGGKEE